MVSVLTVPAWETYDEKVGHVSGSTTYLEYFTGTFGPIA